MEEKKERPGKQVFIVHRVCNHQWTPLLPGRPYTTEYTNAFLADEVQHCKDIRVCYDKAVGETPRVCHDVPMEAVRDVRIYRTNWFRDGVDLTRLNQRNSE